MSQLGFKGIIYCFYRMTMKVRIFIMDEEHDVNHVQINVRIETQDGVGRPKRCICYKMY